MVKTISDAPLWPLPENTAVAGLLAVSFIGPGQSPRSGSFRGAADTTERLEAIGNLMFPRPEPAGDTPERGPWLVTALGSRRGVHCGLQHDCCNDPLPSDTPPHHPALGALRRDQPEQHRGSLRAPFGGMLERKTRQLLRLLGRDLTQHDVPFCLTHRTGRCAASGKACHHQSDCRTVACGQCGIDGPNGLSSRRPLGRHQHIDFGVVQGAQREPVQGTRVQAAALPVER